MDESRFHKAILSLLALLAVGLRALWLTWQPLWWDEGYSFYAAGMPVAAMIKETAEDIHPPLYYALLHFWQGVAGASPLAARFLSVCVGVLTVLLVFRVARYLGGMKLALVAGLFAAIGPFPIYYSQEVRMYALVALLGLASTDLMWHWLDLDGASNTRIRRRFLLAYGAVTLAALYTHYYAVLIPVAQTLFVLQGRERRRAQRPWLACQVLIALLYLPWVLFTITKLTSYISGKVAIERYAPLAPLDFLWRHIAAFSLGHLPAQATWLSWGAVLVLALVLLGVVRLRGTLPRADQAAFLPILIVVAWVGAYAINVVYPFSPPGFERLLLFAAPAWEVLLAVGCLALWRRHRAAGAVAVTAIVILSGASLGFFYTTPRYVQDDYRGLMAQVRTWAAPGDAVLCLYPWQIGYFRAYDDAGALHLEPAFRENWPARQNAPTLLPDYLNALVARYGRVWFPAHQTGGRILETELQTYLAQHYHTLISQWANPHTRLFLFSAPGDMSVVERPHNFGDTLRLVKHALPRAPAPAGSAINVGLHWQLSALPRESLYVGLRLVDDTDYTWSQRAAEPVGGTSPFSSWAMGAVAADLQGLLVPGDTPPGRYAVKVGVYQTSNDRGLDVIGPGGAPQGVEVGLGQVDIVPAAVSLADRVPIQHALSIDFSAQAGVAVRLLGYNLAGSAYSPGETLHPDLVWEAMTPVVQDAGIVVALVNSDGQVVAQSEGSSTLARAPMSHWMPGQPLRDPHRLIVPPNAPPGTYRLRVAVVPAGDRPPFRVSGGDSLDLATVQVADGRAHEFAAPAVPHPQSAELGDEIRLLGFGSLPEKIAAGQTLDLTVYWQALASMRTSYTVFVHLLDQDERMWGQVDALPGNGTLPTTSWLAGEYLRDTYSFRVKSDAPPGRYRIEIGIYDAATGQRRLVRSPGQPLSADRILLDGVLRVTQP